MANERDIFCEDLSAWLDGEVQQPRRQQVAEALQSDPALREELEELRAVRQMVRSLPREKAPADFVARVLGEVERGRLFGTRHVRREGGFLAWARAAAVAAVLLVACCVGYVVHTSLYKDAPEASVAMLPTASDGATVSGENAVQRERMLAFAKEVDEAAAAGRAAGLADGGTLRKDAAPAQGKIGKAGGAALTVNGGLVGKVSGDSPMLEGNGTVVCEAGREVIYTDHLEATRRQVESILVANGIQPAEATGGAGEGAKNKDIASRGNFYKADQLASTTVEYDVFVTPEQLAGVQNGLDSIRGRQRVSQAARELEREKAADPRLDAPSAAAKDDGWAVGKSAAGGGGGTGGAIGAACGAAEGDGRKERASKAGEKPGGLLHEGKAGAAKGLAEHADKAGEYRGKGSPAPADTEMSRQADTISRSLKKESKTEGPHAADSLNEERMEAKKPAATPAPADVAGTSEAVPPAPAPARMGREIAAKPAPVAPAAAESPAPPKAAQAPPMPEPVVIAPEAPATRPAVASTAPAEPEAVVQTEMIAAAKLKCEEAQVPPGPTGEAVKFRDGTMQQKITAPASSASPTVAASQPDASQKIGNGGLNEQVAGGNADLQTVIRRAFSGQGYNADLKQQATSQSANIAAARLQRLRIVVNHRTASAETLLDAATSRQVEQSRPSAAQK